ncbi:FkbM family methyltransferase [Nitrospirillum sp. BR 11828]|uniref:FkbM family methyltransferase n=1 Tax=Nitrospirillum sp. BR 11828 TaxID=3104325 RepID=UPI002ACA6505|nr:FkbM family methyltransferase [Nitrospirillum sp. BR 11828]MDZ5648108.1 FkbM family methyltransferase [Nitrospirillum sp. BR 11828]
MIRLNLLEQFSASQYFDIIRDPNLKIIYSQFAEDALISDILFYDIKRPHGGFYVDVGAYHPRRMSNTQLLRHMSWRGMNIDANIDVIELFNKERPNDINICTGVGPSEGELVYHMFESNGTNTLSPETAEEWKRMGRKQIGTRMVPVKTINQILDENLPSGQSIDYMNIDLEGFDRPVLASLDLERYRPAVISIEIHDIDILNLASDPTVAHLVKHGYKLAAVARVTYIFALANPAA